MSRSLCALSAELTRSQVEFDRAQCIGQFSQLPLSHNLLQAGVNRSLDCRGPKRSLRGL